MTSIFKTHGQKLADVIVVRDTFVIHSYRRISKAIPSTRVRNKSKSTCKSLKIFSKTRLLRINLEVLAWTRAIKIERGKILSKSVF